MKLSIDKLVSEIKVTLEDYSKGVNKALEEASMSAGQFATDELHRTSPSRSGEYRRSWTFSERQVKKGGSYRTELVVYNENHYRLTHLLEKSHRIANKYGSYGKTKAIPHIAPAEKKAEAEFIEVFEKELGRIRV